MANCSIQTGMLFWKKNCIHPALGNCAECRKFVCQIHSVGWHDSKLLCRDCADVEEDSDSGSGVAFGLGSIVAAVASSAAARETDSGSSSSDSGSTSSDSGSSSSSDSGGSSSD